MIVRRFRSVGWVGCVAVAALGCYLVSQRVASERASVEQLDRRIVMARIDIRKLQTELGTRGRMPVLEQWNRDVLALSAPSAGQYLHGEVQLASFEVSAVPPPVIRQVSASAADSVTANAPMADDDQAPAIQAAPEQQPAPAQPMLRHANYEKPAGSAFAADTHTVALLDDHALADLQQLARRERHGSKNAQ